MDASAVVIHVMNSDRVLVILNPFGKSVCQAREAAA